MNFPFNNRQAILKYFQFSAWLFLIFSLVGCQTATMLPIATQEATRVVVSETPQATFTPTITGISTSQAPAKNTKTPTPSKTITSTPSPLPTPSKKILFMYSVIGSHSYFDIYLYDQPGPIFVIYTDGQILMAGNPTQEKMMSPKELERFLAKLDKLGFYTIESNQRHDPSDDLYTMTDKDYERIYDAYTYCIAVYAPKARRLCYYTPFERFLVPQMKELLSFLDTYDLPDMSPYSPDRILISVKMGRLMDNPTLQAMPWNEPTLSLAELARKNYGVNFIGGNLAKKLYGEYYNTSLFIENGQEYTVEITDVWPHEELIAPTN